MNLESLDLRLYMKLNPPFESVIGWDKDSLRVFLAHALKSDQLHTRRIWAGVGPGIELPSQTRPELEGNILIMNLKILNLILK